MMSCTGKFGNGKCSNSKKSDDSPYFETAFLLLPEVFLNVYPAIGAINIIRLTEGAFWTNHQIAHKALSVKRIVNITRLKRQKKPCNLVSNPMLTAWRLLVFTIWPEIYLLVNI
jgi:hypothetical protein